MESILSKSKMYADFDRNGNISLMEMNPPEVDTLLLALKSFVQQSHLRLAECDKYEIPENISNLDVSKIQRRLFLRQSIGTAAEIITKIELAKEDKMKRL